MKNNEITHQLPPWTDVTTVMMRNLPNKYTQHMLLDELQINKFRLQSEFDFFYLPMDHYSAVNLGYCFINFTEPRVANAFAAAFQGRRMRHFNSQKTIVVMPASMQGFEKNYAYYSSTRVAQADDPQYRPIFTHPPACQDVPQYPPCSTIMWAQVGAPYTGWAVQGPQAPYLATSLQQDFATDEQRVYSGMLPEQQFQSSIRSNQDEEESQRADDEEEDHTQAPRSRLFIRNTFLAVPERSPSVERCLQRQCKSAPVSAPQSAAGSARIELDPIRPSGLDFAVVAAASSLAMDLGCVAVQNLSGGSSSGSGAGSGSLKSMPVHSSAGSTTADSEREGTCPPCGSGDVPSETSPPSESDGLVLGSPGFPCKGSALHKVGSCKPCAFHCQGGAAACKNGVDCTFCHLCEPGEKKRRKKEKQAVKRDLREKIRAKREPVPVMTTMHIW
jgi:hypothetical protein